MCRDLMYCCCSFYFCFLCMVVCHNLWLKRGSKCILVFFWCILLLVCTSALFYFSRMMHVKLFLEVGICMC